MKQQEYYLLGVPAGITTNNEMNLEEMRMKIQYSETWSVRLDQKLQSVTLRLILLQSKHSKTVCGEGGADLHGTILITKLQGQLHQNSLANHPAIVPDKVPENFITRMSSAD